MCAPMAIGLIGAGLSMAGSVVQFQQQQAQTDAHNQAVMVNARDSSLAATHKYTDEQRRLKYDAREVQQEGYKAAMKGREAKGTAMASAGGSGFDASSISIGHILANEDQKTAMSLANVQTKMDDLGDSHRSRQLTHYYEAINRTNSMQMKAGPNPLALGINMASSAVDAFGKMQG